MLRVLSLLAFVILVNLTSIARAGIIVSVGNVILAPGGSGFVDITISGDGLNDKFNLFQLDLEITPIGNATRLEFVDPQSTAYVSGGNYIFDGNSFGPAFTFTAPNNFLLFGDVTSDLNDVTVGGLRLLARLEVTAATLAPPQLNDLFQISILDTPKTYFDSMSASNIPVTFISGTATIAAVPEPSSALVVILACALVLVIPIGRRQSIACR